MIAKYRIVPNKRPGALHFFKQRVFICLLESNLEKENPYEITFKAEKLPQNDEL